jgi:predicted RNA methylase
VFEQLLTIEADRLAGQDLLDGQRTARQRNEMGQFATPAVLADDVMEFALSELHIDRVQFLEPSCGSGSFISALYRNCAPERIDRALGVELDERFAGLAQRLWDGHAEIIEGDYLEWVRHTDFRPNLLVANPPYVRHHHMESADKKALGLAALQATGLKVSGLAGLYIYFIMLSHRVLAPDAISAWLIPTEFMDVNYGAALRHYLTSNVELIKVHRFDPHDAQFHDALVSSAVVVFRNRHPSPTSVVRFTFGGSVHAPRQVNRIKSSKLDPDQKWIKHFSPPDASIPKVTEVLGDLFQVRRGIATGANKFFVRPRAELRSLGIQDDNITPVLPSARYLKTNAIQADDDGWPLLDPQLGLIDCKLAPEDLATADPALAALLESADETVRDAFLIRQRKPWYKQEQRPPAPILCTYMGRGLDEDRPFKFIRNESNATATNTYLLLYPKAEVAQYIRSRPDGLERVHEALLKLTAHDLRSGGRAYGGGLRKIEPKEMGLLDARHVRELLSEN